MQVHDCLLNPLSVNIVLEQWGLHCLQCKLVRNSFVGPPRPPKSVTSLALQLLLDAGCKTKSTPSVVSCFSQPADEAHGSQVGPEEDCPEGEVTSGTKQAAMQMNWRLAKCTAHNEKARNKALHVIAVERLLERPHCVCPVVMHVVRATGCALLSVSVQPLPGLLSGRPRRKRR